MIENIMGIMFLLVGAMMVCIVWLFTEMHDYKRRIRELETERTIADRSGSELWRAIEKCEENIAKMDTTIHETPSYSVTTEVNGNA